MNRADLMGGVTIGRLDTAVTYSLIAAQPIYSFPDDRHQITTSASLKVTDEIRTFGSISYDIENEAIINRSFGVRYADECFSLIAEYQNTNDRYNLQSSESKLMFKLALRTLAEADFGFGLGSGG